MPKKKGLDETYTRMLRMVENISWKDRVKNCELYYSIEKVTSTIEENCSLWTFIS